MKVTVCIPNQNFGRYLRECIDSALNNRPYEIIVADNGSIDRSRTILKDYPEIRVLLNDFNFGLSNTYNQMVCESKGSHLIFLNSDDVLDDDCLKNLCKIKDNGVVFGDISLVDDEGNSVPGWKRCYDIKQYWSSNRALRNLLWRGNCIPVSMALVKKQAILDAGYFDPQTPHVSDWGMWLNIAAYGYDFYYMPVHTGVRRIHSKSMCSSEGGMMPYNQVHTMLKNFNRKCGGVSPLVYVRWMVSAFNSRWRVNGWDK